MLIQYIFCFCRSIFGRFRCRCIALFFNCCVIVRHKSGNDDMVLLTNSSAVSLIYKQNVPYAYNPSSIYGVVHSVPARKASSADHEGGLTYPNSPTLVQFQLNSIKSLFNTQGRVSLTLFPQLGRTNTPEDSGRLYPQAQGQSNRQAKGSQTETSKGVELSPPVLNASK